jgi:hypothetical protein
MTQKKAIHTGPSTPALVLWFRSTGFIGLLLGVIAMLDPDFFRFSMFCFYLVLVLFSVDLWFEHGLNRWIKIIAFGVLLVTVIAFSRYWVFVPAPLETKIGSNELNPIDRSGGIHWINAYSDLEVSFNNSTSRTYEQLDATFETDLYIIAGAQTSGLPGCSIFPVETGNELWRKGVPVGTDNQGKPVLRPDIPQIGAQQSARKYRVICPELPSNGRLELLFALVNLTSSRSEDPNTVIGPRKMPQKVEISGRFKDRGRYRTISDDWEYHQPS